MRKDTLAFVVSAAALAAFLSAPATVRAELPSGAEKDTVSLHWLDSHGLCPVALRTAQAESEAILRELGVGAASSETLVRGEGAVGFEVVLLAVEPAAWGLKENVLGVVRDHDALRNVVFVFTPNLIRAAGHRPVPTRCRAVRPHREIGRALARIVVHELVHAVAPEHPHADEGLMLGHISRDWLLEPLNAFDRECADAFVSALGAPGVQ